jgi:hypothetical protein
MPSLGTTRWAREGGGDRRRCGNLRERVSRLRWARSREYACLWVDRVWDRSSGLA